MPARNVHRLRVRYAECDAQGVVFNAHYLAYFDLGITELFRLVLGGYGEMLERGDDLMVVEATVRYRQAARFDEELDLDTTVSHLGTSSVRLVHRLTRACDDAVLADGEVAYVCVDEAAAKQPLPAYLRAALGPVAVPPPGH